MKTSSARLAWFILPLLLSAWLYMPALRLPFFWDDVIHLRYVSHASTQEVLTKTELVAYYRPLVNAALQIPFLAGQHPDPLPWHLILVFNQLINVALVGALARRVGLSAAGQWVAMLTFAVFPFNYQAVIWVLAWFHPLVTSLILITCLVGLRYWQHPQRHRYLYLAWACGMTAPFVHENGVLTGGLLGLLLAVAMLKKGQLSYTTLIKILAPIFLAALVYIGILMALGVVGGDDATHTRHDVYFVLAYFAQGLSFPLQFGLHQMGIDSLETVLGLSGLCVVGLVGAGRARPSWGQSVGARHASPLQGIIWFALASLPSVLLLTQQYTINSPRLLYLGSVGVALLYGAAAEGLIARQWTFIRSSKIVFAALLLGMLWPSIWFIRLRLEEHLALGAGYQQLFGLLDSQDGDLAVPTVVFNAPKWIENEHEPLQPPLGKYGAIMLPDYYALRDLVWANTGLEFEHLDAGIFYDTVDAWSGHTSGLAGTFIIDRGSLHVFLRGYELLYAFQLEEGRYTARRIGQRSIASDTYVADFGAGLHLQQINAMPSSNGRWQIGLTWQKTTEATFPYIVFSHLTCDGQLLDQLDAAPLDNLYDLDVWAVGETWMEYRYLVGQGRPVDCLTVRLGLYDRATGERASAKDATGQPLPDDTFQIELTPVVTR